MPLILKKTLIKWSTLAVLGVSAYFLGYFWGMKNLGTEVNSRWMASEQKAPEKPAVLPSEQTADLRQLK